LTFFAIVVGVRVRVVVEEGLLFEERWQRPTTKRRTYPSCKAVVNVQRCWGWGRREIKSPERVGTMTATLGMPFHRHGFMKNWGLGMVVGVNYYFTLA